MPYMVPSENGGKADVRWMALRRGDEGGGTGLLLQAEAGRVFEVGMNTPLKLSTLADCLLVACSCKNGTRLILCWFHRFDQLSCSRDYRARPQVRNVA